MRISTIAYIFKQGFKNIWRNLRFSLASIATMAACIFLFGVFLSLVMNFNNIVHTAEEGIAVVVYFETGTKQEQIDQIGNDIDKQPGVAEIHYVSADEAWESFKEIYLEGEDESMEGAFKSNDNPLANSARYEVYLDDVEQQDTLVKYIEGLDGVRKVEKSEVAANTLSSFNKLMAYVSLAIVVILLAVAFFLIYNTITMGISVRQEEIGIMKLIGATDFFVRSPFVIEGILLGAIGAAIPLGILYGVYERVINYIVTKFHMLGNFLQFLSVDDVFHLLLPIGIGLGVGIGFFGSIFSVRKHLKV
ncbi:MAG TPA: permease-like cell division protein FtsX [Candidatus Blautia merdavium]|uniref:Cell division protein FtsX n=1 Tax=Candidatus Blautia merdavium TaxID=2838494 RepID=A0A9D2PNB2_9FIRM|nr:permease-like cell division protein FtsX [Candidatus Blautia merdavium]